MICEQRFKENKKAGIWLFKKIASQAETLSSPILGVFEGVHETNDTYAVRWHQVCTQNPCSAATV